MDTEVVELALAGRVALYRALYGVFANEPSAEMLALLGGDELHAWVGALMGDEGRGLLEALMASRVDADELAGAYTRLFVGPARPEAGPWESLYRSKEATLFCQTTLDVRRCYVEAGLIPQSYPHVADDHVALELDFLSRLGERARDAYEAGDLEAARAALSASEAFAGEHLGAWADAWASALREAPHGAFYREAAALLAAFVACDRVLLGELTAALASERETSVE